MPEIYHAGEKEIQEKAGERLIADRNGVVVTNAIIKGAINFIEKQPMAIVSSSNSNHELWISLLIGDFGFTKVASPNALWFDRSRIKSNANDIFYQNVIDHSQIGTLFIELDSRRRFRINGSCHIQGTTIEVLVAEAYPNCPKYIQRRVVSLPECRTPANPSVQHGNKFSEEERLWMAGADTLFVGSSSKEGKLDASHRGGNPGFVEVLDQKTLKIPDYAGNSLFNTLGNFAENPNAGLLFIDFENGRTLQLTGKAGILFDQKADEDFKKTGGTGRFWLFELTKWIKTENHHRVNWNLLDYSPFNP